MRKGHFLTGLLWRTALFAICASGIATLLLVGHVWGDVSMEQVLFHLAVPLAGGITPELRQLISLHGAAVAFATAAFGTLCFACLKRGRRLADMALLATSVACLAFGQKSLDIVGYTVRQFQTTTIFDDVPGIEARGPSFYGIKRNLLVIHAESLEETFNDADVMGAALLPELVNWQRECLSFKGFRQVHGTSWTTAGVTGAFFGLPLLLPIGENDYSGYESFLPGSLSVFEVLERNGYALEFLFPNNCTFGGIENLVRSHTTKPVLRDLRWFSKFRADAAENHGNAWGLRDHYIFERLKEDIALRASRDRPYAFFVKTVDTHGPDTYYFLDPDVHLRSSFHDFRDVVRASSIMIDELLNWLKEQDFARDLTVVVLGDHLWMGNAIAGRPLGQGREVFNLWINALPRPERDGPRVFTTLDFAPTILEAIGAYLPGRRFGIGTSLFSSRPTLIEQLGEEGLNAELGKSSSRYAQFFHRPELVARFDAADTSPARVSAEFPADGFFMQQGNGRFHFIVSNDGGSDLSGATFTATVLDADGTPLPRCRSTFPMPRTLMPGDVELVEGGVLLPRHEGFYTLLVQLDYGQKEWRVPLQVSRGWLWADAQGAPVPADERTVLESGAPLAAFPGALEAYCHGGYIYYKLLDSRIADSDLLPAGNVRPRMLRRAGDDSFRWAAARLEPDTCKVDVGFNRNEKAQCVKVSLLPALKSLPLREERDLAAYLGKLINSDYLVLVGRNDDVRRPFLWAFRGEETIAAFSSGPAPFHFDGEASGVYIDMNAYGESAIVASNSHLRISLRINGEEYAAAQHGLNFVVYDADLGAVVDCATFRYDGDPVEMFGGTATAPARLLRRKNASMVPVKRGAPLASWTNGIRAFLRQGRIYTLTPWEHVFSTTLICGDERFHPLDRAVAAGFDGVLSCATLPEGAISTRTGYQSDDAAHCVKEIDLTPLWLETDFCRYLKRLDDPDLIVFISVLEEGSNRLTETHRGLFQRLGLDMSLKDHRMHGYAAISDGGHKVIEEVNPKRIDRKLRVDGLNVRMVSTGLNAGYRSSIVINGQETSAASYGMNIVVWDKRAGRVVDSVCFNTFADLTASRKDSRFTLE